MSTGKQEEHHEPTGAAGARARRAVIMVAASIVLCIGLLIVLVFAYGAPPQALSTPWP